MRGATKLILPKLVGMGGVAPPRVAGNNKVVHIGDSRALFAGGPIGALNSRYPMTALRQLLKGRANTYWNYMFSVGGHTLAQIQSISYPSAEATDAKTLVILGGVNDLGATPAASAAIVEDMMNDWTARGSDYVAVACDDAPPDTWAGNMTGHLEFRDRVRALENRAQGKYVWRTWYGITGGADGTTAQAGMYTDGLHFNTAGAFACAYEGVDLFNIILPEYDLYAQASIASQVIAAGTLAANDLASSRGGSAGTYTASVVTFEGNPWVQIVAAGADGQFNLYRSSTVAPGSLVAGISVIQSMCEFVLLDGHSNVRNFNLGIYKQSGGDLKANVPSGAAGFDGQHSGSASDAAIGSFPAGEHRGYLWTPPCLYDAAATQLRAWWVVINARTAGSMNATLLLRNFKCFQLV